MLTFQVAVTGSVVFTPSTVKLFSPRVEPNNVRVGAARYAPDIRQHALVAPVRRADGGLLQVLDAEGLRGRHLFRVDDWGFGDHSDFLAELAEGHREPDLGDPAEANLDLAPLLGNEAIQFRLDGVDAGRPGWGN